MQSPLCGAAQPGISLSVTAQQVRTQRVRGQSEGWVCPRMTVFRQKIRWWTSRSGPNGQIGLRVKEQGYNDRMSSWRGRVLAAEAKKAGIASDIITYYYYYYYNIEGCSVRSCLHGAAEIIQCGGRKQSAGGSQPR